MKKITLLLFTISISIFAQGQSVADYSFAQSAQPYTAVVGTSSTATGDDGIQNNVALGFSFNFGGQNYTAVSISTNGWVRLGQNIGGNSWVNVLSNPNTANAPLISAFWDDHNRNSGGITYNTSGTFPNRVFEIGWNNITICTGGAADDNFLGSFKMMLYETTGIIEMVYGSLNPGGQLSASIGLNDTTSYLSVTAAASATASFTTANNAVNGTAFLTGQKYTFTPGSLCASTPNPGATISSVPTSCANVAFTLSLENNSSDAGLTYQWATSEDGINYSFITGAYDQTFTTTIEQATYFQCTVSCGASTATSTPVMVGINPLSQCYCLPTYTSGKTDGDLISNVIIEGTSLSNNSGTAPVNPYYTYFSGAPNLTATLQSGFAYQMTVSVGSYGQQEMSVWIDFNDDAVFSNDEKIGYTTEQIDGGGSQTFTIVLACDAPSGTHRMRIRDVWNTDAFSLDPCANYGYGETEDYDISIIEATSCQIPFSLNTESVGTTTAALTWESGCGQTSWDVNVDLAGSGVPSSANHTDVVAGVLINGLQSFTAYEFYVRANCELTGSSDWAGPFTFTTLALAVANDDCENATALTAGGNFSEYATIATNIGATRTLGPPNPTCGVFGFGGDVWFSVIVPTDGAITVETQQDPGSPVTDTAMTAFSGDCNNLVSLGCSDDEGVGAFSQLNLTGQTPGATIYVRVWEYANDSFGTFQVSAYNTTLKAQTFNDNQFDFYPNPVKDILHLSYDQTISKVTLSNMLGQQLLSQAVGSTSANIDLSHFSKGTYLVNVVSARAVKTIKIIKE